jgi:hypothetical protein
VARCLLFPIVLGIGLAASGAQAGDVSVKTRLSETVEVSDNYFLSARPIGETYRPMSTVSVDILKRTPSTNYLLYGDFTYYNYLGPGAETTPLKQGTEHTARFSINHFGKANDTYSVVASWSRRDVATAELADVGQVTASGETDTYTASADITRHLSAIDTLVWSTIASATTFTSSTSPNYTNLTNTGTWIRRLNPQTDIVTAASASWTVRDDATNSETTLWRITTGLKSNVSQRLSLTANAGISIVSGSAGSPLTSGLVAGTSGAQVGFVGDLLASYRIDRTTRATFSIAQNIVPDIFGNLSERQIATTSISRDINRTSSVTLSGSIQRTTGTNPSDYYIATATYYHSLTKEWRSQLSYSYRQRNNETTTPGTAVLGAASARSNLFSVTITRDFTVLP